MSRDITGHYLNQSGLDGVFFDPGDAVRVSSTGGLVPAFSTALVAPAIIRFTAPPLPSPTRPASAVRSAGLELAWEPAIVADVLLLLGDTAGGRLTCRFPASAGRDTVPGALLSELSSGDATLFAFTIAIDVVIAGTFDVSVVVAQAARRDDNDRARGTLTLQ